ncbi:TB182 protein, partial [Urocolius indicus]|nr:TB182 protein [Urocolius indicus]
GSARPKPPIRPKPRVLPKPAVPAKPSLPQTPPGPRHPRPELPSAEKMNRLAGPQPYCGGSSGGPLRRPSFTLKSPETPNGKGLLSPPVAAAMGPGSGSSEEVPPAPSTPSRKGPAPFKVTPVPVASKPERFPGTTVEEILAKMDSREGPGSPDRARLSAFCPDSPSRFGSKTFTAFRRRPSGEADGGPPGEAPQAPQLTAAELGTGHEGRQAADAGSALSCSAGRPPRRWAAGSDRRNGLARLGSRLQPPRAGMGSQQPSQLPAPGSPTLPPGSPESPAQPPDEVLSASVQTPGAPSSAARPQLGVSRSPGSPHTPGEGSPQTASPPGTPKLPLTCPPGSPEAAAEYPTPPSPPPESPTKASRPPGSPEGPEDSPASPQSHEGPDFSHPPSSRDSALRRASEGVLRPPTTGQGLGELGGSLSALPRPGDPLPEPCLGSESGWSLSQSFEWTFPARGARWLVSPPRSPIREAADSGLSEDGESEGEGPAPRSRSGSGSEGAGPEVSGDQGAQGAPCPGGPVAQPEAEGSAEEEEEEEGEAERDVTEPHSPLCVMEPGQDPAEPQPHTQPDLVEVTPPAPAPLDAAASGWVPAGDWSLSLQGPGGPDPAEGSSRGPDAHPDPGWLTELLASPGAHGAGHGSPGTQGTQDLLGWSRKDLCSEFGIGRPRQAGTFDWTCEAVPRERDWPGETKQDQEFGAKSSWDSTCGVRAGPHRQDRPFGSATRDWGSDLQGTELPGETRPSCGDWSRSTGQSCLHDQGFGAGTAKWGTGSGEEVSTTRADWSSSSHGHSQQQDGELSSQRHGWAGRDSLCDTESPGGQLTAAWAGVEMKDRELTSDWDSKYSSRDAETKDKDFTLGWAGRTSTGDTGSPDTEFSPSRVAWDDRYSSRDRESQDREFSPSRPAETRGYSSRDRESQDREFSPSRPAETRGYSSRDRESQDREFSPSRPVWASECSCTDTEEQERESSCRRLSWAGERSAGQADLADAFGARKGSLPGSPAHDAPAQEPVWGSTGSQEQGATTSRDWAEELGGAERHNQFGVIGVERVPDPSSADGSGPWAGAVRPGGLQEPLADWHGNLSFGSVDATGGAGLGQTGWGQGLGTAGWSSGLRDAEAKRRKWADAFGARCAARSRDHGTGEQSLGDLGTGEQSLGDLSTGEQSLRDLIGLNPPSVWQLSCPFQTPNPAPAFRKGLCGTCQRCHPLGGHPREDVSRGGLREGGLGLGQGSCWLELRHLWGLVSPSRSVCVSRPIPAPGDALDEPPQAESPRLTQGQRDLPGACAAGPPRDSDSEEAPSDHPDGERPRSREETPGQEFAFLEDTEVLDCSVYRSKGSLGRKRRHRAPALRPAPGSAGSIFRDSTEPRPAAPAASSDEEATEEPRSRRVRAAAGRAGKVPLFPGLSTAAIKAKLRGRNRSAEEGGSAGDSKATPHKDPHVQRSKSCKIPSLKPPALPPKPEKASG